MGGNSWLWSPGMYVSDSTAAVVKAWPITSTTFWVYATDLKGCKDTQKVNITVNPGAVLDAGDDQIIYPGETAQLYAQGNCSFFTWFPPNGLNDTKIKNPIASPSVTTRYFVTAQTESGCAATDSVDVIVSPESVIDLPNAFSPGTGSSINDQLTIIVRGVVKLNTFRIFNRWGEEVFSSTDINKGWDGRYKGVPQPMGVYVYVLEAVSSTGKRFYKQGNVTLLR
jgi:gliding motility-associated-like protein